MSGYRSIHREKIGSFPIWQIACTSVLSKTKIDHSSCIRIWVACGDGAVRGFLMIEKTAEQKDSLNAAACSFVLTHLLYNSPSQQIDSSSSENKFEDEETVIGCSQLQLKRNYVGEDDKAGSLIIASCDLSGKVMIWELPEDADDELLSDVEKNSSGSYNVTVSSIEIAQEFVVENATGTCMKIMSPNVSGTGDILLAAPCLDGSIALVTTGLSTPKSSGDATEAGTIIDKWFKNALNSIALTGAFHPKKNLFAVGRQDGLVEISEKNGERYHRLIQHEAPVRALSFTPDGNLLVTASDDGLLCLWDMSRRTAPALVQHVIKAHASWIVDIHALYDSRRFISCGMDQQLKVFAAGELDNQALHTFTSDESVWTIDAHTANTSSSGPIQTRLVSGSENGKLHVYTLES